MVLDLFYLCENSGYPLYENYGKSKVNWIIEKIPCAGRIEKDVVIDALNKDANKVVIISCFEGACNYLYGNVRCKKRIDAIKKDFESLQLNTDLVEFYNFTSNMDEEFKEIMDNY